MPGSMLWAGKTITIAAALFVCAGSASAEPAWFINVGSSHGGDDQLRPGAGGDFGPVCSTCFGAGEASGTMEPAASASSLATVSVGLAGREGRARGGGELMTIVGLADRTTGYTAVVTYAGVDDGLLFAQGGLGIGSYWGGEHENAMDALAGDMRAEVGVRLHRSWLLFGRADLIVNSTSAAPVGTFGLAWIPRGD